jgi:ribose 5-phosphate isomerase A
LDIDGQKKAAAEKAALLVEDGMRVGLGTGSTVAYLLPALAARRLDIHCVATSARTETAGTALGLRVTPFTELDRLDLAIDGADQADRLNWLVKGGGGAHVREKIVAAAADRFVVIISADKLVDRVGPAVPVELLRYGLASVLRAHPAIHIREGTPASPDGGVIADWTEPFDDPEALSARLAAIPGLVGHGLFPPTLVSQIVVGD